MIPVLGPPAHGSIEIYVNGHKYGSMQEYLASKKSAASVPGVFASSESQQEGYIRQAAQQLGINVDFSKAKTFQIDQRNLTDKALHQLYVLSVENGVVGALKDFYQGLGQPASQGPRRITVNQLQGVIRQAVTSSKDPKLLISEPGKVRIMALTTDDASSSYPDSLQQGDQK